MPNDSIDIAIFSLSLMGTNFLEFVQEAHRVLHKSGCLWIAEVSSRFGDNGDEFAKTMLTLGFKEKERQELTKMFLMFEFEKIKKTSKPASTVLKPCLYKKR